MIVMPFLMQGMRSEMNKKKIICFSRRDILYLCGILVSSFVYSFGMNTFVKSGNLFPGGYAGIARLLSLLSDTVFPFVISFSAIYWVLNVITMAFVWKRVGHKFILYSFIWFSLTSFFTGILKMPEITSDPLLIAIFGGLVNGAAIGLALKSNASSGGTDFIAIDLSIRLNRPTWNYLFAANAVVLVIAGLTYGWNQALYSIIFQNVSKEAVNTLHQRFKISHLEVVTDHGEEVSHAVFENVRHGITKLKAEGEFSHKDHSLLMMDINSYQLNDVIRTIKTVATKAFNSNSHL